MYNTSFVFVVVSEIVKEVAEVEDPVPVPSRVGIVPAVS
jgi:hypothetical protein